ncbi:MAG: hypothetical protein OEW84_06250 [Aigarchaeota archaeon]|nr:hypothetical protein [Aigarchaeota archaeon]
MEERYGPWGEEMRSTGWLLGAIALLILLGLVLIQIRLSHQPETTTTTSGSASTTATLNTGSKETTTFTSKTTSESTVTTTLTYKYNLTVLSFGIRVYNYTYDNRTSSGQAILSWILTAASATDYSFNASVKQYESAAGGELLGFYKMLLKPGEPSVLRSEIFKLSFTGSLEEMMHGGRAFKLVFSYPPEENGYSVGWYKAKMIYFNLSGDWDVYVLRPSD